FGAGGIFRWIGRLVDAPYESPELTRRSTAPARGCRFGLHPDEALGCLERHRARQGASGIDFGPAQSPIAKRRKCDNVESPAIRSVPLGPAVRACIWSCGFPLMGNTSGKASRRAFCPRVLRRIIDSRHN